MLVWKNCGFILHKLFSPHVLEGWNGVMQQHSRPCIFHDFPIPPLHLGLVAVNRTFPAGFLLFPERTAGKPCVRIFQKLPARTAQLFVAFPVPAIKPDHLFYRPFFFFYS